MHKSKVNLRAVNLKRKRVGNGIAGNESQIFIFWHWGKRNPSNKQVRRQPIWYISIQPIMIHFNYNGIYSLFLELFLSCSPKASIQFSSVTQSCPTLCGPRDCSMPGFPVPHHLPAFAQVHVHRPFHPLLPSSPSAFNLSQHQNLFQWVNC